MILKFVFTNCYYVCTNLHVEESASPLKGLLSWYVQIIFICNYGSENEIYSFLSFLYSLTYPNCFDFPTKKDGICHTISMFIATLCVHCRWMDRVIVCFIYSENKHMLDLLVSQCPSPLRARESLKDENCWFYSFSHWLIDSFIHSSVCSFLLMSLQES